MLFKHPRLTLLTESDTCIVQNENKWNLLLTICLLCFICCCDQTHFFMSGKMFLQLLTEILQIRLLYYSLLAYCSQRDFRNPLLFHSKCILVTFF